MSANANKCINYIKLYSKTKVNFCAYTTAHTNSI